MSDGRRVGILISGRGSNMVALVDAMKSGAVAATPAIVVSNKAEAPGVARARERGVPVAVVEKRASASRREHEERVIEILEAHRVDLVCLAGYMRLLSPHLVSAYAGRMLNIHPSLLPAFPGLDAQKQALDHGVKLSGCTVHFVDEECDHGPIVLQAAVPVLDDDSVDSLSERILEQELRIYPRAVALCVEKRVAIAGRRVLLAT